MRLEKTQFDDMHLNTRFEITQPNPRFEVAWPNPRFEVTQPNPRFKDTRPNPQFEVGTCMNARFEEDMPDDMVKQRSVRGCQSKRAS